MTPDQKVDLLLHGLMRSVSLLTSICCIESVCPQRALFDSNVETGQEGEETDYTQVIHISLALSVFFKNYNSCWSLSLFCVLAAP